MKSYNGFSPELRNKSQRWINAEYAAGRRQRPTKCVACGQTKGIFDAHSEDYSEPFGDHIGEFGICFVCHMMLHCRYRNKEAWEEYKACVRLGYMFKPFHTRNFGSFASRHLQPVQPIEDAMLRKETGKTFLDSLK